ACDLQACLNKNTYKPEQCDERLRALYICCQKMYDEAGGSPDAKSTACPLPNVVNRWLKEHSKETKK
ncbi:Cx9C motif-containing protein 4, mitochondrial, partial [Favolaschia claudopus]